MSAYSEDFRRALAFTLWVEGRYSNRTIQDDPGGETFMGISKVAHPDLWFDGPPSVPAVVGCYYKSYWTRNRCGELPWPMCLIVFDFCVNSGGAIPVLQRHLGISPDGRIGPITMRAFQKAARSGEESLALILAAREVYMTKLGNFQANKNGWFKRVCLLAMEVGKCFEPIAPFPDESFKTGGEF